MGDYNIIFEDNKITNAMIMDELGDEINTGKTVCIHVAKSSNPEYITLYFAQRGGFSRTGDAPLSGLQSYLKKFNSGSGGIIRAIDNVHVDTLEEIGFEGCGVFPMDIRIRVYDSFNKSYPTEKPVSSASGVVRKKDGKEFYQKSQICYSDEFDDLGGHEVFIYDQELDLDNVIQVSPFQGLITVDTV